MALQVDATTPHGLVIQGAYVRVMHYAGDKNELAVQVRWYASQEARLNEMQPLNIRNFVVPVPAGDILPGIYAHLKTLPEFAGAVDC